MTSQRKLRVADKFGYRLSSVYIFIKDVKPEGVLKFINTNTCLMKFQRTMVLEIRKLRVLSCNVD